MRIKLLLLSLCSGILTYSQTYPTWGPEIPVIVVGLTHDAMEPHISADGNAMFFNNLNDGITTEIYYSSKVNDSTFSYLGLVPVVNQTVTPRLDGVASVDTFNNFYWVSTRNYPTEFDNLFHVTFLSPGYTNFGRVHGDFYIYQPGWLIMDAAISYDGEDLYYCNAFFDTCGIPCNAKLGIAEKMNDSTFNKNPASDYLLSNINIDTLNYIIYAPCITSDGLELYYTRAPHGALQTEICVAVRSDTLSPFSIPMIIEATPNVVPEAPTLTYDKNIMYYHKKVGGTYQLVMRYRTSWTSIKENDQIWFKVFPNPTNDHIEITYQMDNHEQVLYIYDTMGKILIETKLLAGKSSITIDVSKFLSGLYFIQIGDEVQRLIIE